MKKLLQIFLAGWGAKKIGGLGCGCIGTVVVFLILFGILGFIFDFF